MRSFFGRGWSGFCFDGFATAKHLQAVLQGNLQQTDTVKTPVVSVFGCVVIFQFLFLFQRLANCLDGRNAGRCHWNEFVDGCFSVGVVGVGVLVFFFVLLALGLVRWFVDRIWIFQILLLLLKETRVFLGAILRIVEHDCDSISFSRVIHGRVLHLKGHPILNKRQGRGKCALAIEGRIFFPHVGMAIQQHEIMSGNPLIRHIPLVSRASPRGTDVVVIFVFVILRPIRRFE
mmetsp:Transcript_16946/g.39896  ORF Transcript_16946/g.39896 Transcript_16946/m.39896 type:complete len:232 (-) Transcript_16946:137-832(-)